MFTIFIPVGSVILLVYYHFLASGGKKSRIRETKHLSTDAIEGWTKNTPKPNFFEKREKIIQNANTQKHLEICQN